MSNVGRTSRGLGRWVIVGGFALLGVIVIVAAVVSAWQANVQQSHEDKAELHSSTVSLLQNVEEEATIAANLLQQYVAEGDDTLIAEFQGHAGAGVEGLTSAAAQSDAAAIDEIAADATGLAEGAGRIIALRQSGDVPGAVAALEEIGPEFERLNAGLAQVTEQEVQEVAAHHDKADRAEELSLQFLVVSAAAGAALGLAFLALIARFFIRRRVSKPAVPV